MNRQRLNRKIRLMIKHLSTYGDQRYQFRDSEQFDLPSITVEEDNYERTVAEVVSHDIEGYNMVHRLNSYTLLVNEVVTLKEALLKVYDLIPANRIQDDEPGKDGLLYEIYTIIENAYYGKND